MKVTLKNLPTLMLLCILLLLCTLKRHVDNRRIGKIRYQNIIQRFQYFSKDEKKFRTEVIFTLEIETLQHAKPNDELSIVKFLKLIGHQAERFFKLGCDKWLKGCRLESNRDVNSLMSYNLIFWR